MEYRMDKELHCSVNISMFRKSSSSVPATVGKGSSASERHCMHRGLLWPTFDSYSYKIQYNMCALQLTTYLLFGWVRQISMN